jgi:hypothetical protein
MKYSRSRSCINNFTRSRIKIITILLEKVLIKCDPNVHAVSLSSIKNYNLSFIFVAKYTL